MIVYFCAQSFLFCRRERMFTTRLALISLLPALVQLIWRVYLYGSCCSHRCVLFSWLLMCVLMMCCATYSLDPLFDFSKGAYYHCFTNCNLPSLRARWLQWMMQREIRLPARLYTFTSFVDFPKSNDDGSRGDFRVTSSMNDLPLLSLWLLSSLTLLLLLSLL